MRSKNHNLNEENKLNNKTFLEHISNKKHFQVHEKKVQKKKML